MDIGTIRQMVRNRDFVATKHIAGQMAKRQISKGVLFIMKTFKFGKCGGELEEPMIDYPINQNGKVIILENVFTSFSSLLRKLPVNVCRSCGEMWFSSEALSVIDKAASYTEKPRRTKPIFVWSYEELAVAV
jgi:hypothetical protein